MAEEGKQKERGQTPEQTLNKRLSVDEIGGQMVRWPLASRRAIVTSLELCGLCVLGKFSSACIEEFDLHASAEIEHELFVVGSGLIMTHLLGLPLFRPALPLARLRIPRIIEDLLIFLG